MFFPDFSIQMFGYGFYVCKTISRGYVVNNLQNLLIYKHSMAIDFCLHVGPCVQELVSRYKKQGKSMPELLVLYFTLELLLALYQMHQCNIIHGDLKPDNVVVCDL